MLLLDHCQKNLSGMMKYASNRHGLWSVETYFYAADVAIVMENSTTVDGESNPFHKNGSIDQTEIFTSVSNMVYDNKSNVISRS